MRVAVTRTVSRVVGAFAWVFGAVNAHHKRGPRVPQRRDGPRVALVNVGPQTSWCKSPNFGLLFIAAYLKKHLGIDSKDIVFADQTAGDDALEVLGRRDWDIAGFSATSIAATELNELVPAVRERWPDRTTVVGGVHVSALPELTLRQSKAHFGVLGDGEVSLRRMIEGLSAQGEVPLDTPGLVWLENGTHRHSPTPTERVDSLDDFPPLPLEMLNREHYFGNLTPLPGMKVPAFPWLSSRGCVFKCRFCCVNVVGGGAVRFQSPGRVIEDLERLVRDYDVPAISFIDDNFVVRPRHLTGICEGILSSPILKGIKWACNARADCIKPERLELMKRAGCVQMSFGFESGSQRMLTYLKQGSITIEDARNAIAACRQAGIRVQGMFMVGSPGETREDVEQTLAFIRENRMDYVSLFAAQPWPGSEFWDLAVERGIVDPDNMDWRALMNDRQNAIADSLDIKWLNRLFMKESLRLAAHNYSLLEFLTRTVRAFGYHIRRGILSSG